MQDATTDASSSHDPSSPSRRNVKVLVQMSLLRAPELQPLDAASRLYWDRSHYESPEAQVRALQNSATVYVGNLAFTTRSRHVWSFFSQLGPVKTIHMGLDRLKKTPCGFCFVEFGNRSDALAAVTLLSGSKMDGNVIRVELDAGFQPGRQYGRGRRGGQVRDDKRPPPQQHKRTLDQAREGEPPPPSAEVDGISAEAYGRTEDSMDERPAKRQRS